MMTDGIYLLLGSNMGDKLEQLSTARALINAKCPIINSSSIYQTAAWGKTDQPSFYNQVIEVKTGLSPTDLLDFILSIEAQMGRERKEKWGERIIDIDILYYHDHIINSESLAIPHPEIQNRRFTLVPLIEIAADHQHPVLGKNQVEILEECKDQLDVRIV